MLELPNPTNNLPGCTLEHHFNDHCLTRGEDGIDCTDQSSDVFNTPVLITRTLYAPRTHEPCGSNRYLDSPAPLPHASEDTHRRNSALGFQVEEAHSSATRFCLERPRVVDSTRTCSVQSTSNSITSLRPVNQKDASLTGWGATCNNQSTGGHWGPLEAKQHINALELKAAYLALQSFLSQIHPPARHILLEMDNTTAVAYLNKRGGTHSTTLSDQALQIGNMC